MMDKILAAWGFYSFLYVIVACVFGLITRSLNKKKGYNGGFAWGFFLAIIGIIVVAVRPFNQNYHAEAAPAKIDEYSNNRAIEMIIKNSSWECICGARNPSSSLYCEACKRRRPEEERSAKVPTSKTLVTCPHCGTLNKPGRLLCYICEKPLEDQKNPEIISDNQKTKQEGIALLKELSQLHQQGILTDEEFEQKKADILEKL